MKKALLAISIIIILASVALVVFAHPGDTDGAGGHYNRSTGEYHYHHGYSEHSHYDMDGDGDVDCPYDFKDKTDHRTSSSDVVTVSKSDTITFPDVLSAMLSSILPSIAIFLVSSYILSYIFLALFGENKGCTVSIISGAVVSVIAYVWSIIAYLT